MCFTSQVAVEHLERYREAHAAVWPSMLEALRDAGWRDYHLYLREDGLLIAIVDFPDSHEAAQARMDASEVNARWQDAMAALFAAPGRPDEGFQPVGEVFHLEGQLEALGLPTESLG
jgi:L-rhamnose mutarotase